MATYIWQLDDWTVAPAPLFSWQVAPIVQRTDELQRSLDNLVPQSSLIADAEVQIQIDALVQTALRSSEIEGEVLDARSVRSSVVNKLGLDSGGLQAEGTEQTDALAGLLVNATTELEKPVTLSMLCDWQAALFVEPDPLTSINIGKLRGDQPMQVVSGRLDRPTVHFEAPPRAQLEDEIDRFLNLSLIHI